MNNCSSLPSLSLPAISSPRRLRKTREPFAHAVAKEKNYTEKLLVFVTCHRQTLARNLHERCFLALDVPPTIACTGPRSSHGASSWALSRTPCASISSILLVRPFSPTFSQTNEVDLAGC